MSTDMLVRQEVIPLGVGYYTVPEAARLLGIPARNITRWLGGYKYRDRTAGAVVEMPPLWTPHLPRTERHIELDFRDLIELRFVKAFLDAGLRLPAIRAYLEYARDCVKDDRPFSTRRFRTDGRTIFLDSASAAGDHELLDLKQRQYVIKATIERTLRDLDIEADAVTRWRPFRGKGSIVIDPKRAFGQPIASRYGVPTVALAEAVAAEGSVERVAALYEVSVSAVRDALEFERSFQAA
jgi:uncharacterized protein (DUF433 family)